MLTMRTACFAHAAEQEHGHLVRHSGVEKFWGTTDADAGADADACAQTSIGCHAACKH